MELKDTVDGMLSDDYKERFVAEYQQCVIRKDKLQDTLSKHYTGELDFELSCPARVLEAQLMIMSRLMYTLEERAAIEGIELH